MKLKALLSIILVLHFAGCATIFKGTKEKVDITSQPESADVYVNGVLMGETPCQLLLESKKTYAIEFRAEGYDTATYHITNTVGAGWIVLDILAGLVGIIIDAATGAWYSLDTNNVNMVLIKQFMQSVCQIL